MPRWLLFLALLTLGVDAAGGLALFLRPGWAPALVLVGIATAAVPLVRAWRRTRATGLRAAVAWGTLALILAALSQVRALGESAEAGRPWTGHLAYLATLAALAAAITVLNARRPGGGAWAILMGLLILLFLLPWVEGSGLARGAGKLSRLRLDAPWTLFYGLLVVAGVTNYLPTRYGGAAAVSLAGFVLTYLGLTRLDWSAEVRARLWSLAPMALGLSAWSAEWSARRAPPAPPGLERLWSWFRDHWGVVWALRVRDRFNRAAEAAGWPIRLSWFGVVSSAGDETGAGPVAIPAAAEAALKGLLRRFADPGRLDEAAGRGRADVETAENGPHP